MIYFVKSLYCNYFIYIHINVYINININKIHIKRNIYIHTQRKRILRIANGFEHVYISCMHLIKEEEGRKTEDFYSNFLLIICTGTLCS
jgi:hypothetical protein